MRVYNVINVKSDISTSKNGAKKKNNKKQILGWDIGETALSRESEE